MIRVIIAAVIIYVLYKLWKRAGTVRQATRTREQGGMSEMVACERCGTFILTSEAIYNSGHSYCSESCRKGS